MEKKVLRGRIKKDSLPVQASLPLFSSEKGLHKRLSFILETLFPRPEILRQVFVDSPDLNVWQLYYTLMLHKIAGNLCQILVEQGL